MIRAARFEDLPKVIPLFEKVFAESPFEGLEIDLLHIQRMFAGGVVMPNFFAQVIEEEGEILGFMAGVFMKNIWGLETATDLFFYAEKDSHKLIRSFRRWAKKKGAKVINMTNISGRSRYDLLIHRLGLEPIGMTYMEKL